MDKFFVDKPTIGGWKAQFLWCGLPFCLIIKLVFFKSQKYGEGMVKTEINAIFGLTTLKHPYHTNCLCVIWVKIFGTWEILHSHCFGHVTWKLWVGLHAEFISLQSTGQVGQSTESLANQWNGGGISLGQLLMCCCHNDFSECDLTSTLVGQHHQQPPRTRWYYTAGHLGSLGLASHHNWPLLVVPRGFAWKLIDSHRGCLLDTLLRECLWHSSVVVINLPSTLGDQQTNLNHPY